MIINCKFWVFKSVNLFLFIMIYCLSGTNVLKGQNTLYDENIIPSIYLYLPPDSLADIYNHPTENRQHPARFIFVTATQHDTLENVAIRLRGNTSRLAAKKSFKISFNEYVSGRKYQGVKKLNLNGQHNDPTMVREKLFYHIWARSGMPERRANFARVYINDVYYGLYTNLEELDKVWLGIHYADDNGNLFKCTYPADLDYLGNDPQAYKNISSGAVSGGRAYDLQTNETSDDYTVLVDFITALYSQMTVFQTNVEPKLIYKNMLKALAIDVGTGNWDDYAYNKNNYYLYFNPSLGKCDFISYDTDNTFGVDWDPIDWTTRSFQNWANTQPGEKRPLAVKLLQVPSYYALYAHYMDSLNSNVLLPFNIFPYIDSLHDLVRPAAIDDTYRTLDYGYDINDFDVGFVGTVDSHTPYGIKPFLTKRHNNTVTQLMDIPEMEAGAGKYLKGSPNPAREMCYIMAPFPVKVQLDLYSAQGRLARTFPAPGTDVFPLDLSGLSAGIYYLRCSSYPQAYIISVQ